MKKSFLAYLVSSMALFAQEQTSTPAERALPPPTPFEAFKEQPEADRDNQFYYNFLQMLSSLGIIIVLLFLVSYFTRRMLNSRTLQMNTTSSIKILDQRALSTKTSVYKLEVDNRTIVLAESANGITLLQTHHDSLVEKGLTIEPG